ncbi:MAG: Tex family protein [SAR202 cluster bacterium]|nr:Tex family protein [SAR202 cluster bacterium]
MGTRLKIEAGRVRATVGLLDEGATVPFIARYRKEATGALDEVEVAAIRDRLAALVELDDRKAAIVKSLDERDLLTDSLDKKIQASQTMTALEDIYLPFRPKRRSRATIARERGLEPLAEIVWAQDNVNLQAEAEPYVDESLEVMSADDALSGARDIIAERVSEDGTARARLRALFARQGTLRSKVSKNSEESGVKYRDYFDWEEPLATAPSHRVLAMLRGEKESFLSVRISPSEPMAIGILTGLFVKQDGPDPEQVSSAIDDGYKRLLGPAIEREARNAVKERADRTAIEVFAENLRELLLAPPLGRKNVLAADPGFRTGAKVVCLDRQGKLLYNDTIYPLSGERSEREARSVALRLIDLFEVEVIAVGNGTGGRETEAFFRSLDLGNRIPVILVNENGASIYSASDVARAEFPDHDLTVRGAVSIGRRLVDPLAELVKIDPRSIGVGQYQHDVDQKLLKERLDDVVASCVNSVGVDVNTASEQLLSYVSGLGPRLAHNIVEHRDKHGAYKSRNSLKDVPRLGRKAYEQAAGFLRVRGDHPLDASAVHPERYTVVNQMAKELGCSISDLMRDENLRERIDVRRHVSGDIGLPTLNDILAELGRPGRDPRQEFEAFSFTEGINSIEDVNPGMTLPGIVTNVAAFGAFVDIGVHQDGLVHVSQLADTYVNNPSDVVKVQQVVSVRVLDVDIARRRISLSMKSQTQA